MTTINAIRFGKVSPYNLGETTLTQREDCDVLSAGGRPLWYFEGYNILLYHGQCTQWLWNSQDVYAVHAKQLVEEGCVELIYTDEESTASQLTLSKEVLSFEEREQHMVAAAHALIEYCEWLAVVDAARLQALKRKFFRVQQAADAAFAAGAYKAWAAIAVAARVVATL